MQTHAGLPLVAFLVLAGSAQAQGLPAPPDTAEIRTAGVSRRPVTPGLATLTISFMVEDSTPAAATRRLALRADSLRRAWRALTSGRDSAVSATTRGWWPGRVQEVPVSRTEPAADPRQGYVRVADTVYRATESLEVRVRDLAKLADVIEAALALQITDISAVTYGGGDFDAAQREALREATIRARTQAEQIAAAAGGRLGRVLTLSSEPEPIGRVSEFSQVVTNVGTSEIRSGPTPTSLGVSVTVYGRWQLLPGP